MKSVQEAYPLTEEDREHERQLPGYELYDYQPLLESFEYDIVLQVDEQNCCGDSFVLLRDKDKIGVLIFGWGSCSGCDALQQCRNYGEVEELQKSLHESIQWFETPAEALNYFKTHDWEGDYSWHISEAHEFVTRAQMYLESLER